MMNAALVAAAIAGFGQTALAGEAVRFNVTIRSVTTATTLALPGGGATNAPIAPGIYAVGKQKSSLFKAGKNASAELERLAEDGNFEPLAERLGARRDLASGSFIPDTTFTITARPGDRLSFATMFVQSNDIFLAPRDGSIALFTKDGRPVAGDVSMQVAMFDAGTEINQAPGAGPDQAPRQKGPNVGASQHVPVQLLATRHDGFQYPPVASVVKVTIEAVTAEQPAS
jgi:hypothetical protein